MLVLGLLGLVLADRGQQQARERRVDDAVARARTNLADARRFMLGQAVVLQALAASAAVRSGDEAGVGAELERLLAGGTSGFAGGLAWYRRPGAPAAATRRAVALPLPPAASATLRTGLPAVGATVRGRDGRPSAVVVAVPTAGADGRPNGVLAGYVPLAFLRGIVENLRAAIGDYTVVVDRDGDVLAAPGLTRPRTVAGHWLFALAGRPAPPGSFAATGGRAEVTGILGTPDRLVGWAHDAQPTGWSFFTERPASEAFSGPRRTFLVEALGIAVLAVLALAAAAMVGRRLDALAVAEEAARGSLAAEARRLSALQRAATAMASAAGTGEVASILARSARDGTRADGATVLLGPPAGRPASVAQSGAPQPAGRTGATASAALVTAGRTVGTLAVHRAGRPFDAEESGLLEALAAQSGQALQRIRLSEAEHEVAVELQRRLLPQRLPEVPGAEVAVAYRPAHDELEVGGDWYDVVATPGGGVLVVVGDVVGRGVRASGAMGQLRIALSALAREEHDPALLIDRLERFAAGIADAQLTTVCCAHLEPATGALRYACAGHPPPLSVPPAGPALLLPGGRSAPLCVTGEPRTAARGWMAEGAALVLYTDGLVERRRADLDERFTRLREVGGSLAGRPAPAVCEGLLERMLEGRHGDDTAVLCLRRVHGAASLRPE